MAISYSEYTGDGVTTAYGIPFGYLDRSHVQVYVEGDPVEFSFVSDGVVSLAVAPAAGLTVRVQRVTSQQPYVEYQNGETLTVEDLDNVSMQALYLAQEAQDNTADMLTKDVSGNYDVLNSRIRNLADPVDGTDAANKDWTKGLFDTQVDGINSVLDTVLDLDGAAFPFASNFTGDGGTKQFTLDYDPRDELLLTVLVDGNGKTFPNDFTVVNDEASPSGKAVLFVVAPAPGARVHIRGLVPRRVAVPELAAKFVTVNSGPFAGKTVAEAFDLIGSPTADFAQSYITKRDTP